MFYVCTIHGSASACAFCVCVVDVWAYINLHEMMCGLHIHKIYKHFWRKHDYLFIVFVLFWRIGARFHFYIFMYLCTSNNEHIYIYVYAQFKCSVSAYIFTVLHIRFLLRYYTYGSYGTTHTFHWCANIVVTRVARVEHRRNYLYTYYLSRTHLHQVYTDVYIQSPCLYTFIVHNYFEST